MAGVIRVGYEYSSKLFQPYPRQKISKTPQGIEGLFFTIIMEALGKPWILFSKPAWANKNLTTNHVVKLVYSRYFDMAVSNLLMTEYNYGLTNISYTHPYLFSTINFQTNMPQMKPRVFAYLYSFDKTTWALIATTILLVPIVYGIIYKLEDRSKNWLNMFGNLLGRSATQKIKGPSQSVFTAAWFFGCMILFLSYSSLILSCLTVPALDIPPQTFHQLSEAIRNGEYKATINKLDYIKILMENSSNCDVKYIFEEMEKNEWWLERKFYKSPVFERNTAYFGTSLHHKGNHGMPPFHTRSQSEGMYLLYFGMVVHKHLPTLKKKLDKLILRALAAGLLDKLEKDHFYKMWISSSIHRESDEVLKPISFKDLIGVFIILGCGLCVSTVVFIFECIAKKLMR